MNVLLKFIKFVKKKKNFPLSYKIFLTNEPFVKYIFKLTIIKFKSIIF